MLLSCPLCISFCMHRVAALEKIQVIHAKKNKFVLLESMQSELDWLCICKCAYPCDIYLIELCRVKKTELLFRMVFKQCVNWSPALKNAGSYVRWLCTIFGFLPYGNCMLIHWSYAVGLLLWRQKMWVKLFFTVLFLSFPGSVAQYEATTTLGFSRKERPRRRPHSLSIPLQSVHAQKSHNILWKCFGHKRWRRW